MYLVLIAKRTINPKLEQLPQDVQLPELGLSPKNIGPINLFIKTLMQKFDRFLVRSFLDKTDWAAVPTIALLLFGNRGRIAHKDANKELSQMSHLKRPGSLKRLPCSHAVVYANPSTKRKRIGNGLFDHDNKTREVVAKMCNPYGIRAVDSVSMAPPSDARIGNIFIEFDNGHMTDHQLEEKILKNYSKAGMFQVAFIMASPYKAHWRTKEKTKADEIRRLNKLFAVSSRILPHKPNRIIGASYEQFLEDGKFYNCKGHEVIIKLC